MKIEDKLNVYRLLGAEKFQKIVFWVEDKKYKIIDKFFPNIISWYDNIIDKQYNRKLKSLRVDDSRQELLWQYKREKLLFRKELAQKKNRNYHYDRNRPTQIVEYLKMNKRIHQKGILCNVVSIVLLVIYSLLPLPQPSLLIGIFSAYQLVSLFINFQCINLQNYNLCRFEEEKTMERLKKLESRTISKNIEKMEHCISPVSEVVREQIQIPTIDTVVDRITTREQALELLNYAKKQLNSLNVNNQDIVNQKKLGGR